MFLVLRKSKIVLVALLFMFLGLATAYASGPAPWPGESNVLEIGLPGTDDRPVLTTESTIGVGDVGPEIVVKLTGTARFQNQQQATNIGNWEVNSVGTGLTGIQSITGYTNNNQVTIKFNGTATGGKLVIRAKRGALSGTVDSEPLEIFISGDGTSGPVGAAVITTDKSSITQNEEDPVVNLTLHGASFNDSYFVQNPGNWNIDVSGTGLSVGSIERTSDNEVKIKFDGTFSGGTVRIQAKPEAIDSSLKFVTYRTQDGSPIFAEGGNKNPDFLDITSGLNSGYGPVPSVWVTSDGQNVFFRMLIRAYPLHRGSFKNANWLINIAADSGQGFSHIASVGVDGRDNHVYVASTHGGTKTVVYTGEPGNGSRVIRHESTGHYFVDFQVPISKINDVTKDGGTEIKGDTPVKLYFGTSAQFNNINKDYMMPGAMAVSFQGLAEVKLESVQKDLEDDYPEKTILISTNSQIEPGKEGPSVILKLSGGEFEDSLGTQDFNITVGGLTLDSVIRDSSDQVRLNFEGTAEAGILSIHAEGSAIKDSGDKTNTVVILVDATEIEITPDSFNNYDEGKPTIEITKLVNTLGVDFLGDLESDNGTVFKYELTDYIWKRFRSD